MLRRLESKVPSRSHEQARGSRSARWLAQSAFPVRWLAMGALSAFAALSLACQPTIADCKVEYEPEAQPPEYVLLEYRLEAEGAKAPQEEIRPTPKYNDRRQSVMAAAIRFPDSCLNDTASKVTGVSQQAQTILQTNCGPWLGELEKALSAAGYKVFSWDALYKLEREKNLSTYNAGKQLGADVVFVFNSLEAGDITAGGSAEGRFQFFASNDKGERFGAKALESSTIDQFVKVAQGVLGPTRADQVIALSSIIDATAVFTDSGESVWFYRRVVTFPVRNTNGMRFLFGRYPAACGSPTGTTSPDQREELDAAGLTRDLCPWRLVGPRVDEQEPTVLQGPQLSSEVTVREKIGGSVDAYRAQRLELIRAGAKAFVGAFKGGSK